MTRTTRALLAAAAVAAFATTLRGDDALDKQYLARRIQIDEPASVGLVALAKKHEKKGCLDRARDLAKVALDLAPDGKKKEAQALLDRLGDKTGAAHDSDVENQIDDWCERQKKHYEEVVAYCEKRKLEAEQKDALARIALCESASTRFAAAKKEKEAKAAEKAAANGPADKLILNRVNRYRKEAGVSPVTLDDALTEGCKNHCNYLVVNDGKPELEGLKSHVEDMSLPGATESGSKAGTASDIAWGRGPAESVDAWMASLYHRIPILHPDLKKVGAGFQKGTKSGGVCCLDVQSAREGSTLQEVLYPADGLTGVPLHFGNELPDPIPQGSPRPAGFPVTLTGFGAESDYKGATGKLETGKTEVPCYFSSPEKPAGDFAQSDTICLIPVKPLEAGTTYKATITYSKDGGRAEKTVTFTTRK